jgi:hypothetical protein
LCAFLRVNKLIRRRWTKSAHLACESVGILFYLFTVNTFIRGDDACWVVVVVVYWLAVVIGWVVEEEEQ